MISEKTYRRLGYSLIAFLILKLMWALYNLVGTNNPIWLIAIVVDIVCLYVVYECFTTVKDIWSMFKINY